jgi:hypothetical protein
MSELSADEITGVITHLPTSRYNRTVPYKYAGYSFTSDPDLPAVPETDEEQFYTIGFGEMFRPDLVANRFYSDSNLWWFVVLVNREILMSNGRLNFLEQFLPGVTLRIPSQQTAFSYINARQ